MLCARLVRTLPRLYFESSFADAMMQCAIAALNAGIAHRDANAAVFYFLADVLKCARDAASAASAARSMTSTDDPLQLLRTLQAHLSVHGRPLTRALLRGLFGVLPYWSWPDVGRVLWLMTHVQETDLHVWLNDAAAACSPSLLSMAARSSFVTRLLQSSDEADAGRVAQEFGESFTLSERRHLLLSTS